MTKYRHLQRPPTSQSAPPQLYSPDGHYPLYLVRQNELQLLTTSDDDGQHTPDETTMESRDIMDTPNRVPTDPTLVNPVTLVVVPQETGEPVTGQPVVTIVDCPVKTEPAPQDKAPAEGEQELPPEELLPASTDEVHINLVSSEEEVKDEGEEKEENK